MDEVFDLWEANPTKEKDRLSKKKISKLTEVLYTTVCERLSRRHWVSGEAKSQTCGKRTSKVLETGKQAGSQAGNVECLPSFYLDQEQSLSG